MEFRRKLRAALASLRRNLRREDTGTGSVHRRAPRDTVVAKKTDFLNDLIAKSGIKSLVALGPQDKTVLRNLSLPNLGGRLRTRIGGEKRLEGGGADLAVSLDVLQHLDNPAFEAHMRDLFRVSGRFVVLFARNVDLQEGGQSGARHRRFTEWVRLNAPGFILVSRVSGAGLGLIENPDPAAKEGVYPDFYVYKKLDTETYPPRPAVQDTLSAEAEARHRELGTLRFDVVTVIYNDDLPLLRVQARSFARNLADGMVESIVYCINERKPGTCEKFIRDTVVPLLGVHAGKARLLNVNDIGTVTSQDGWLTQQACKLAAAELCTSPFYLVLDAKHHILRPVTRDDLFDEGRGRKPLSKQRADQLPWLLDSLRYFGVESNDAARRSPASAPPIMMHVQTTRDMVADIVSREGKNLVSFFGDKSDRSTEFTLYYAYLVSKGLQDRFLVNSPSTTASLRISMGTERRERLEHELDEGKVWCFSIHRRRLSKLSVEDRYFIVQTWVRSGLFPTEAEAYEEISRLKRHFVVLKTKEDRRRLMAEERIKRIAEVG